MAKQNKVVSVLSTSAISGLVASALMTSQAFAAVDAYTVKVGGDVYQYSKTELMESYLDSTEGAKAPLFEDFQAKMTAGKGVYAYHDDKSGYVTAQSVFDKYLENEAKFNLDEFTASKDAKVTEVPTVKKAVVKDGEVKFEDQNNKPETNEKIKVESVSAINLNQVKIKFTKKVQEISAENISNYKLANDTLTNVDHAKLLDDEQTVIITLDDVKNQNTTKSFEVKDSVIQQKDSGYSVAGYKSDVKFEDLTAPTVEKINMDGAKTLKITFSEGVKKDNATATENYKLDGQSISSFGANIVAMNKNKDSRTPHGDVTNEVKIEFDSPVTSGKHTITIGASTSKDILDASNFALQKVDMSFAIEKVTGEPQILSATGKVNGEVTLKFNVKMDKEKITNNAFQYEGRSATRAELDSDDSDDKTIKVYFDASFDEGANVLKILEGKLEDVYGNKVAPTDDKRISFTVSKDNTAPVLKDAYAVSERKIRLVFDESIDDKYLGEMRSNKNIKLKNSDGDTEYGNSDNPWESVKIVENHSNELELTIPENVRNNKDQDYTRLGKANYTIVVKDICDKSGNEIVESKKTFTTIDNTDPKLKPRENLLINDDKQTAKILFNEPMDSNSVGNLDNYLYNVGNGDGYKKLPSGSSITVANNGKSATISFPKDTITGRWLNAAQIRVMNVKDAAGNTIDGNTADTATAKNATTAIIDAPDFIDNLTVYGNDNEVWATIDVNDNLDTLDKNDFKLSNTKVGKYLTISPNGHYVPKSVTRTGKTLTITWDSKEAIDAFKAAGENIRIPKSAQFTGTTNEEGIKLYATDDYDAEDKVAPKLVDSVDYPVIIKNAKEIEIKFNEEIKNNASLYEDDFSISIKGKSVDSDDIDAKVDVNKIVLTLTNNNDNFPIDTPSSVTVKFKSSVDIKDTSGNLFVPSTDEKTGRITIKTAGEQAGEQALAKEAAAETAVKAYENAKYTTLAEIESAEKLGLVATAKVNDVAADKKAAFTGRITTQDGKITAAKNALQATETEAARIKAAEAAVKEYEDALITTENEVILAKALGQIATSKVSVVTTVDTKAALKARVDAKNAIIKIDEIAKGGSAAGVTIAEIKAVVGDIADAKNLAKYQAAISAAEDFALNSADKIKAMVTDVNTPVGVALNTAETTKGVVAVTGANQVSTIKVKTGAVTAAGDITVAGKTVAVAKDDTASVVAEKIKTAFDSDATWTVTATTDTLTFTAKAKTANVDSIGTTGTDTTGVAFEAQNDTTKGKAEVLAKAEVETTTVTGVAGKDATIKVNVADGKLNKTVNVAVVKGDTAEVVAGKIRAALAADAEVKVAYDVTGADANIILTQKAAGSDVVLAVTLN